jgi:FHS family L-fucose permease-like MFS transporter
LLGHDADQFSFCHLPEITEEALTEELHEKGLVGEYDPARDSFWRQYRCIFGFVAQMCYW